MAANTEDTHLSLVWLEPSARSALAALKQWVLTQAEFSDGGELRRVTNSEVVKQCRPLYEEFKKVKPVRTNIVARFRHYN